MVGYGTIDSCSTQQNGLEDVRSAYQHLDVNASIRAHNNRSQTAVEGHRKVCVDFFGLFWFSIFLAEMKLGTCLFFHCPCF